MNRLAKMPLRGAYTVSYTGYGGLHYAYVNGQEACSSWWIIAVFTALYRAVKIKLKIKLKIKTPPFEDTPAVANDLIDIKKSIHDQLNGLWAFIMKTGHPAGDEISHKIRYILFHNMRNEFEQMEKKLKDLIDCTRRFEITWDCMDCLEDVKRAGHIHYLRSKLKEK